MTKLASELQEGDYRDWWAKVLDGETEYRLPDGGRVDVITADLAVEVKIATDWRQAVGQALAYAIPLGKAPVIALYGSCNVGFLGNVLAIAQQLQIRVLWCGELAYDLKPLPVPLPQPQPSASPVMAQDEPQETVRQKPFNPEDSELNMGFPQGRRPNEIPRAIIEQIADVIREHGTPPSERWICRLIGAVQGTPQCGTAKAKRALEAARLILGDGYNEESPKEEGS